ncbi:glycoside hydrolase family 88/105 protein [Cohnella hongkongensis]|uniref:Glycoside hydrolase family 105 protein n=1 Tax=Cohnella hongkongensis TaxID=178337 RepID=A0ABV9FBV1_9BACL
MEREHSGGTPRSPVEWGTAICDTIMAAYAPEELPPAGRWHYHQGVFLSGMEKLLELGAGGSSYESYIRGYADALIDPEGNFLFARDELDSIQAGLLLFRLDRRTGDRRYRIAANRLRALYGTLNRTAEGGFWHKDKYPGQMWLDGLYMGGVYALKYAAEYGDDRLVDLALEQERLMRRHMRDARTGLLFHAWDEKKRMPWADPETGCSPELWGRSLGWYGLALAEFLELLPQEHAGRGELEQELAAFANAVVRYQDEESGLWYQIVDKGERADNWLETSCSSLFVYTLARAAGRGLPVSDACRAAAGKGFRGLVRTLRTDGRVVVLPDICIGTSAGDYAHYAGRPKSGNDLHGVGAFVMACAAMAAMAEAASGGDPIGGSAGLP